MLRIAFAAAAVFAVCASAAAEDRAAPEEQSAAAAETRDFHGDHFVWTDDACGASRYEHLVGQPFAELHNAALPADASVWDKSRVRTLEYRPGQLNVVLDDRGRIIAIGCF